MRRSEGVLDHGQSLFRHGLHDSSHVWKLLEHELKVVSRETVEIAHRHCLDGRHTLTLHKKADFCKKKKNMLNVIFNLITAL